MNHSSTTKNNELTNDEFVEYNLNGISRCFGVTKIFAMKVYEEGERTNSCDYDGIIKKHKSGKWKQEYKESKKAYAINKISDTLKISQKYATKIFEEGEKIGSKDYKAIHSKMKFMKEVKQYMTQLQNESKLKQQGGNK